MAVWAISDLHLPAHQKPMDVFGPHWQNHFERIREDWLERVSGEDVVLLPGDLSWAMHLEEALEDLSRIGALPGRKILLRGNHDYWWSSIGRVRRALPEGCYAIQNDSLFMDGLLFAGSRGWQIPAEPEGDSDDARIYRRERQRLEMSLASARARSADAPLMGMAGFLFRFYESCGRENRARQHLYARPNQKKSACRRTTVSACRKNRVGRCCPQTALRWFARKVLRHKG